jgi:hypothetical protein
MNYRSYITIHTNPYRKNGVELLENGTELICRTPHIAPLAWCHKIFPPLHEKYIYDLEKQMRLNIPPDYQNFLKDTNGINLFSSGLKLYGMRFNFNRNLYDVWQPFDIITPNTNERPKILSDDILIIGSAYDGSKIAIIGRNDKVIRFDDNTFEVLNEWENFDSYLTSEIERLELLFEENGVPKDVDCPKVPDKTVTTFKLT